MPDVLRFRFLVKRDPLRTVRAASFALLCLGSMAAIVMPAVRAQRNAPADRRSRDVRTLAQQKINPRVLTAIYHRRGDAKGKVVPETAPRIAVDRHGRALVDVRAQVRPELQKKIKALGGVLVSTSNTYDSIVGWLPLQSLERLAADPSVRAIEPAQ
jgi:hypothetical protein